MNLKHTTEVIPDSGKLKLGDILRRKEDIYIVAAAGARIKHLVCLSDGNIWEDTDATAEVFEDGFTRVPAGTELTFTV